MSRVNSIIKTAQRKQENNGKWEKDLLPERQRLDKYLEREEEEKLKDEGQKTHERYRRKQNNTHGADLTNLIKPAKSVEQKPGTYFYGTLKKLGTDFDNDIVMMEKHFTLGQSAKYSPDVATNKIYCTATAKLLYDCGTGECFEK